MKCCVGSKIIIIPLTLAQANKLIEELHRHHKKVVGHRFSIGAVVEGKCVGACVVGRPVARMSEQYKIAEVTRLVTDGTKNACSALYGAAARIAKEMGFEKIQTFILLSEPGTSLKASGWTKAYVSGGGDWNRPSRGGRRTDQPLVKKEKWEKVFKSEEVR
jgi:hypothetical protein